MKSNTFAKFLIASTLVASAGSSHATLIDFYYGSSVVATMTTSGSTTFQLDFTYAPAVAGTAFINDVLFLNTGNATLANSTFTNMGPEDGSASYNGSGYEGGPWNWKVSFPTSNSLNRFQEGESTIWKIETTELSQWDFGSLHINAFLNGASIKLSGCDRGDLSCVPPTKVPEPSTIWLLGAGLFGLGLLRRRRATA